MEIEQVNKRVDWLDEERRKDKSAVASLEEQLISLEGVLNVASKQIQDLSSEITHLKTIIARIDQFDDSITQVRKETSKKFDEIESAQQDRVRDQDEFRRVQIDGLNGGIIELRKQIEQLPGLQASMALRMDEERRLSQLIDELRQQINDYRRDEEDTERAIKLLEEAKRRDEKRLIDNQGEVLALRKRADEQRGRIDLAADSLRRLETRVNELATVESERRESYNSFVEKQTLAQVERDRKWNGMVTRFDTIETQAAELESHLQTLHTAQRDVKRAATEVENLSERVDRRINEITEMQRLAEDRFRQEWVTFKADDQKRWTNYSLVQEEQVRESSRSSEKLVGRLTTLEERIQTLEDINQQIIELTEKRQQQQLAMYRDWVAEHEKSLGGAR